MDDIKPNKAQVKIHVCVHFCFVFCIRRAKLGQIQGGGGGGCRGQAKIRQWGVAIIFYFLRVKNITF